MTSYDVPHTPPAAPKRPGTETRQVLLTLGALCLIVAFTAGTALVWATLGRGGQIALMTAITVLLLIGAATVRTLQATAEALGAVGLAGCVIDAVAARTLHLSIATGVPLHLYVAGAALAITLVAATLSMAAPRLAVAPVGWSSALLVAAVATVNPTNPSRTALLAPVGIAVAAGLDTVLRRFYPADTPARVITAVGAANVAIVGFVAALIASAQHDPSGLWGAAVPLALFALPALAGNASRLSEEATAAASGITAGLLMIAAGVATTTDIRTAAAIVLPILAVYALLPDGEGWVRRIQVAVSALILPGVLAWASLVTDPQRFAGVDFALAVAAAGMALAWPQSRAGSAAVRNSAAGTATVLASIAVGITLDLHGVTTPEAYVATPALLGLAWGSGLLMRDRHVPSLVLAPGLLIGLLPTLTQALGTDHTRQIVLLVVAALIVSVGAELRLRTPLVAGAAIIGLLSVRLAGPQLAMLPHWLTFGAVGAVLLTLGATWDARLADARRLSGLLRPRIDALR